MTDPTTIRYTDWFAALGHPIPEGNRLAAQLWIATLRPSLEPDRVGMVVGVVAREIERDNPDRALRYLRTLLEQDETAVLMAVTYLCCPPAPTPMTLRMRCPGCGRDVELIPPRDGRTDRPGATIGREAAASWRRKAHPAAGPGWGAVERSPRCRFPVALTPDEIAQLTTPTGGTTCD